MAQPVVAGLLAVGLLLCLAHGLEGDHALTHVVCVPAVGLVSAVVVLPIVASTGWLLAPLPVSATSASLHLPDPPPKPFARS